MWLLVFLFCTTVSGQSQLASSHAFLSGALAGFDPFYMNALITPNPGRRSQLFQPLQTENYATGNQAVPNSFINNAVESNCRPDITVQKLVSYKDFKDFSSSSAYELSFDPNWGTPLNTYDNFTLCETRKNHLDRAMLEFFRDNRGEIFLATSRCITHTITIAPFEPVTFTPAFQGALVALYRAAVNPNPEIRTKIYAEFVQFYGTHFSRRTFLGSQVILGKLFPKRAATIEEEIARRQCVLESAREALTPCLRGCNETMRMLFTRASTEKCGEEKHEAIVAVTGLLPEGSLEDWASAAKESPQPFFHDLEPLSNLFNKDWFDIMHQSMQLDVNSTALHLYFKDQSSDYSSRMVCGGSNKSPPRGCTSDSDHCTDGTECRNEPYTTSGYICIPKYAPVTVIPSAVEFMPSTTTTTAAPLPSLAPVTVIPSALEFMPSTTTTTAAPLPSLGCGESSGKLYAVQGVKKNLTSHPGFGTSEYDDYSAYSKLLVAPSGLNVRIRLLSFQTESCCDHLFIYDSPYISGKQIAKLSGIPTLSSFTSSGHKMLLLFITDHSSSDPGFSLVYEAVA